MRQIDKALLDELSGAIRKHNIDDSEEDFEAFFDNAWELSLQIAKKCLGSDTLHSTVWEVMNGILGALGLCPGATNATIYKLFEVLGYEVVDMASGEKGKE